MAWKDTEKDKMRHQLRMTIGATTRVSQILSLAPYPLTLFQGDHCDVNSDRNQVVIFFRHLFAIFITGATVASQFVLFFFYPDLLYQPTAPAFIKILYYIVNVLQSLTVANLMIGCERRRLQYEGYFSEVLQLIRATIEQSDCEETIWYRNTAKALLIAYSTVTVLLPFIIATVHMGIGTIPYAIAQVVPFTISYLILAQYYCVYVHLSSIARKLNKRLTKLVSINSPLEQGEQRKGKSIAYDFVTRSVSTVKEIHISSDQIDQLRLLHVQTIEITNSLCINFGLVIILIVVAAFASINIELLEMYQSIRHPTLTPLTIFMKFIFAMIKFSFFVLIAYPNRLIQNENQSTLFMLYKIRRSSYAPDVNGVIKNEKQMIRAILFQIEHYISQIANLQDVYQACGMINLDMKLISNVVAAITSIMVVLIQFADSSS
ncbi:uncharacterized protein LOC128724949 [Anopheles nili]|uniref:uncharacterized protein LOC128724949 n=1 Tax=Anopheles nili TaxID=185578 RepID=UPI00237A9CF1|nr:uncharacterized protein LOC128724949 [Anopheles nili]